MNLVSFLIISVIWVTSSAYVMYYHNKHYTLGLDMIIGAILLGPILALIVGKDVDEKKKYYGTVNPDNSGNNHNTTGQRPAIATNHHPTVKPIDLCRKILSLFKTPNKK